MIQTRAEVIKQPPVPKPLASQQPPPPKARPQQPQLQIGTLCYLIIVHVRLLNKLTLRRHNSFSIALTGS